MMEKMRTLFNVVVLFVLMLFGSVVPASAQEAQGYGGVIQTVVVSVSASLSVVAAILAFWWKVDSKIDAAKRELKDDAREAHSLIGTNINKVHGDIRESEKRLDANINKVHADIRESEKRLDANINKVHADVQLLLAQAIRGRPSENAQDRP